VHAGGCRRRCRSRFDYADDFHAGSSFDLVERQRSGSVAGDDQEFRSLILQVSYCPNRVVGHRGCRFRSVGKARRVSEVEIVRARDAIDEGTQHRESPYAGVEHADGWVLVDGHTEF